MADELFGNLKEPEKGIEPLPEEGTDAAAPESTVAPEELQKVKDIIISLTKAIKAAKIYPENNPIYQKFTDDLMGNFSTHLNEYGNLKLRLTQFKLLYQGAEVYDNPDKLENIALKLFTDGVREITFNEGLEDIEILNFLDVLNANLDPEKTEDDIVTLLWEKNFQHITYFVIDEAGGSETEAVRVPIQELVKAEEMDASKKKHLEAESGMPIIEEKAKPSLPEMPAYSIYTLTEEEVEQLKEEKEAEENPAFTFKIIDILYEILYMERDFKAFSDVVDTLEKAVDLLISRADLVRASRLLKNLREIADAKGKFSAEEINRINLTIDRAGDAVRMKELKEMLNNNQTVDLNALSSYLTLLHKNSVPYLLELLEINNLNMRKHICDAIEAVVKEDVDLIGRRSNDKRWYVVRNIAYIIGKLGNARGVEYLSRTLKHDEPRVRMESIKSLMLLGGEKAKELLLNSLADNDSQVRILAVRSLASLNHKKAVEPLIKIINQDNFRKAEFAEKKEFFEALGKIGSNEIVPFLKKIITKKPWFKRSSYDELRACSAFGLGKAGTSDALAVLEGLKEKPGSKVHAACTKALTEIKGSLSKKS